MPLVRIFFCFFQCLIEYFDSNTRKFTQLTRSLRLPVISRAAELAPVADVVLLADADAAGGRRLGHEAVAGDGKVVVGHRQGAGARLAVVLGAIGGVAVVTLRAELALGPCGQGCQMAKFDPFLSVDCAGVEGEGGSIQGKEVIKFCSVA